MIIFDLNPCLRCCRRSAWNHHAFLLRLAYKNLSSKLIHVNRVSSSPAPRASKLLHRLCSHSLRSEAALKVFFGYMPHLSFFLPEQIQQNNPTAFNYYATVATNLTLPWNPLVLAIGSMSKLPKVTMLCYNIYGELHNGKKGAEDIMGTRF